jgi:putative DNA primase/helicase
MSSPLTEKVHLTDLGNARRLVRVHGDDLLFCPPLNWWLFWDGRRWRRDESEAAMRAARDVVSEIFREAGEITARAQKADTEAERASLAAKAHQHLDWALKSESRPRLEAIVAIARSERKFVILPNTLDRDPRLLNVLNGTVDLRTGELRPHDRGDYLTKLAPVAYKPGQRSNLWERFLDRVIPDPDARRFAQKAAGFTLTGNTGEDIFLLIYGPTRSGKGTFQDALASALGDYALTAELELLAEANRQDGSRPRPELVRLQGARMVSIYETSSRLLLSASLLKSLAGSDPITARDLYGQPVTFRPQFTLWIATNHRPRVPADDDALWERLRELPFSNTVPEEERDPKLRRLLRTDAGHQAAVLAWAVEGCLMLREEGLGRPEVIRLATQDYRAEMDALRLFVEECCVLNPSAWVKSADLRARYETWAKTNGEKAISGDEFRCSLRARGCEPEHRHGGRGWRGIGLREDVTS